MLKAKLDSVRKNKKGFSLVELIIVMAIMVALIAVLAPQFVKYVQRARDSSVTDAADNCFAVAKSEYALGNLTLTSSDAEGTIVVTPENGNGKITLSLTNLSYADPDNDDATLDSVCGIEEKNVNSSKSYTITIKVENGLPTFAMDETA